MTKFKSGDKVSHAEYGNGKVIHIVDRGPIPYYVRFGKTVYEWCESNDLTLRKPKWHDMSNVPTHNNNVKVKLNDGSKAIGYYAEECGWHVYPPDSRSPSRATCGDTRVRRWRELKPGKPK